jgi:ATP-dependent exoDNAse (exonuclease V) beta subunit
LQFHTKKSKEEIVTSAKQILTKILHHYSRFSISTIDSFIHDILRIFSHDLKLPDNFTVEIDTEMLADMVVSELLFGLESPGIKNASAGLSKYIIDLALNRFEEKDNWDITYELKTFSKLLFSEEGMNNIPYLSAYSTEDFSRLSADLGKFIGETLTNIRHNGKAAIEAIHSEGLTEKDFYFSGTGIYGYFNKAQQAEFDFDPKINSRVQTTIDQNKWVSKGPDIPEELKIKLTEFFRNISENPLIPYLSLSIHLRTQIGPLALLGKMQQILNDYETTNQSVPISQFNKYIAGVVRNEPAPFIYERLGQKFRHFLIDEFQDTSVIQWQNFLPLIENSLSQNNYTMIVGDVKQSIYRFRNGEMEQLMKLPLIYDKPDDAPHYHDIENTLKQHFSDKSAKPEFKNTNYRSGQYIVEFNNTHFSWIKSKFLENDINPFIPEAYHQLEQKYAEGAKEKGLVCLYPVKNENYRELTLNQISDIISSHASKGDIAILTRGNASAKQIAAFLMQQNPPVPVISSESLELSFSPAVNFIIDMLRFIYDPNDHIAILGAYTYLHTYKTEVTNFFREHHEWINNAFLKSEKSQRAEQFRKMLHDCGYNCETERLASLPVNNIVTSIIKSFELSVPTDAYVLFFQNKLNDYLQQNKESISGVLKWWNETGKSISIVVPEGTDAVRILSIHKSKGLQFPVVIYPFADFKLKDTNSYLWVPQSLLPSRIRDIIKMPGLKKILIKLSLFGKLPEGELRDYLGHEIMKQELDALNIHYVAMTRAKHELHILFKNTSNEGNIEVPKNVNNFLSAFIDSKRDLFTEADETVPVYRYGKREMHQKTESKQHDQQPVLNNYNIRISGFMNIRTTTSRKMKAVKTGELFHEFMASTHNLDNLQEQFNAFCTKLKPGQHETEILKNMLNQFTEHHEIHELFSSDMKHLNEITIIDQSKTFRPDKVVYNQEKTFIVDFKTGKKLKAHEQQIENYKRLLEQMNFKKVTSVLVYVSESDLKIIKNE